MRRRRLRPVRSQRFMTSPSLPNTTAPPPPAPPAGVRHYPLTPHHPPPPPPPPPRPPVSSSPPPSLLCPPATSPGRVSPVISPDAHPSSAVSDGATSSTLNSTTGPSQRRRMRTSLLHMVRQTVAVGVAAMAAITLVTAAVAPIAIAVAAVAAMAAITLVTAAVAPI